MAGKIYNVLFLCTGNSARSQIAECILNRVGRGRFVAYSAGSHPVGAVNPYALDLLTRFNYRVGQLRSKDWSEFASSDAPEMDFVFTMCDKAAEEACPVWPAQPMTAHWGLPDPAEAEGSEADVRNAFADVYREISKRIGKFVNLPLEQLNQAETKKQIDELGR